MLNLISQYAKRYDGQLEGLACIARRIMQRFVTNEIRDDHWKGFSEFKKKKEVRNFITAFNKKPKKGMKILLDLFKKEG